MQTWPAALRLRSPVPAERTYRRRDDAVVRPSETKTLFNTSLPQLVRSLRFLKERGCRRRCRCKRNFPCDVLWAGADEKKKYYIIKKKSDGEPKRKRPFVRQYLHRFGWWDKMCFFLISSKGKLDALCVYSSCRERIDQYVFIYILFSTMSFCNCIDIRTPNSVYSGKNW